MKPQLLTPMQYGKYCEIHTERDLHCSFPIDLKSKLYSEREKQHKTHIAD